MKVDGYKTYIFGTALIAFAIGGAIAQKHSWDIAIAEVLVALKGMSIRHGIAKATK